MKRSKQAGFVLIVILLAILIIGIFAGGVYFNRVKTAKELEHQTKQQADQIEKQMNDQVQKFEDQMNIIQENDLETLK